ncbi:MAG: hypothetical protein HKN88_03925 [Gammaproteobacteria bacterium]|nr:hypothetical protein [Gammaproteobacteria bacterium]NNC97201.1 hypothetical protein [Gammaproteobacteria bacterium]NNM14489.1 hypothetical protein [Gammaproteobacteria bacterium]
MTQHNYLVVSAIVFLSVAIIHLVRILQSLPVMVSDWSLPMAVSWCGLAITGFMAYWAYSLLRKS